MITYDRRGTSRSSGTEFHNFDIGQQARDAVAVLDAAGFTAARIVGSSGGAVIALEMARGQPQAIDALVAHEPPVVRVLPDAAEWQTDAAEIYLAAWQDGPENAIQRFAESVQLSAEGADMGSAEDMARIGANIDFFLKYEMLPFTNYLPDAPAIIANGVKVAVGVGELSRDRSYGQTVPILAERLECPLVVFPGHHASYQDMAEKWVAVLRDAFRRIDPVAA